MRAATTCPIVWLALALGTAAPGWPAGHGAPDAAPSRFRLTILIADWEDLGRAQEWSAAWPRLKQAAGNALLTIDERDVAAYDWQAQRIVLHPAVSLRVLAAVQERPEISERLRRLRALWSTDDLMDAANLRGFVVSLDGRPLYGGIFLHKHSQLSMGYPVIHVAMDDDRRIVLRLSPIQFAFGSLWDDGTGDALESAVDPAVREIQEVFSGAKERMDLDNDRGIERHKRRIRDPRVEALFAALGTPAQAPDLPAPAGAEGAPPVPLGATPYMRDPDEGWSLFFSRPAEVAEIRYRFAGDPAGAPEESAWGVASDYGQAPLGRLAPGRYRIDVEALDWAGARVGRYPFWLDTEREAVFAERLLLERPEPWVAFHDRGEESTSGLYFHHLLGRRDVLREIRYSLDDCDLDRRFSVSSESYSEEVPAAVDFACVQLVYRDGEATAPRRFAHHPEATDDSGTTPPGPAVVEAPAPPPGPQPVSLRVQQYSSGWQLYFDLQTNRRARQIRYRFGRDPEWRSTGPDIHIDLTTGERFPSQQVWLAPRQVTLGRHRVEVKLTDWSGVETGPYTLWFDPEAEIVASAKSELLQADRDWAAFDEDYGGEDSILLSFLILHSYRDALREVRYSLDACGLDQRLPFEPWTELGKVSVTTESFLLWPPRNVKSACVQLVFRDGEVTESRLVLNKPRS